MVKKIDKNQLRLKRHLRIRKKVAGTAERPRLNVFRSNAEVYVQIIDDVAGVALCAANSRQKALAKQIKDKSKTEVAKIVGEAAAKAASEKGITEVVFDRGGYVYRGRVKAVADGAREGGLKF